VSRWKRFRPPDSDADLVAQAQNGDGQAFELLVARHERRFKAVARNFAHPWDPLGSIDDCWQTALTEVWAALRQRDELGQPPPVAFGPWASTVARYRLTHHLRDARNAKRWPEAPHTPLDWLNEDQDALFAVLPSWTFTSDPVFAVIVRDQLARGWKALKPGEQKVINGALNGTETRYSWLSRARRRARDAMHDDGGVRVPV
jgi:DNA-directed RNA polymerase specialized sigma24 family protein